MKRIINTTNAPAPIGPYNQAVLANNVLYISGQIALDPNTKELIMGSIPTETHQILKNLEAVLQEAEMDISNVVKCSIFLSDMNNFPIVNEVYGSYFKENYPARETVQVSKLPMGVNVEISAIAVK